MIKNLFDRKDKSFTLLELILVVVLMGIMAAYAIPSYQKAIEKNEERVAIAKLQAIVAGMKIYNAQKGDYPAFDMPNVTSINQNLGLSVVPDTMTYTCYQASGIDTDVCTALHPDPNNWRIHWHPTGGGANTIHCSVAGPACPSCPFWNVSPYSCG